jgi:RHS repeat-associated protein
MRLYTYRQAFIGSVLLLFSTLAFAQPRSVPNAYPSSGMNINFVRTWDALKPETNPNNLSTSVSFQQAKMTTQYVDGLGRPIQTVVKQGSMASGASAKDAVSAVEYDAFSREQFKYLAFAANTTGGNTSVSDGLFKLNPFQQQEVFAQSQHTGETYYYGQTVYEASGLNRVNKTLAPGDSWVGGGKGIEVKYWANKTTDGVRIWNVTNVSNDFGTYATSSTYNEGELSKTVTIDEAEKQVIEFTDKNGKLVLKKAQLTATADNGSGSGHDGWLCTYYIYDDLNQLRAVIQPKAVEAMRSANDWTLDAQMFSELTFRYEYDARGRMTMKKVPGAGAVYMVYDKRDRLVLTQDANLRGQSNKWLFTKYDALNRPIMTGFYNGGSYTTQSSMQGYLDGQGMGYSESITSTSIPFYSLNQSFPVANASDVLTMTFYDDYSWTNNIAAEYRSFDASFNTHFSATSTTVYPYPKLESLASPLTRGLVTGTVTRVPGVTLLTSVNFYDDKGRVIQNKSENTTGGCDVTTTQYSFSGQPLITVHRHQKLGTNAQTTVVVTQMTYDDLGRVTKVEKKLSNTNVNSNAMSALKTVVENSYDALGQLKTKKLGTDPNNGSSPLEQLTYDYNIRSWLLGVNRSNLSSNGGSGTRFAFELGYDKQSNSSSRNFTASQYNGNISGMIWESAGDGVRRKYDYSYDNANRFMQGLFEQDNSSNSWGNNQVNFDVKMGDGTTASTAYDYNGNIKKMQQWGLKGLAIVPIDNLTYSYQINASGTELTNKLYRVTDAGDNGGTARLGDFKDGTIGGDDYSYDANGNLTLDNNKAISSITYNHLNAPSTITITGKGSIDYVYDASGNKLKKVVHETGKPDKTTLYIGDFVYEDDELKFLSHEEGRIRYEKALTTCTALPNRFIYDFFVKDHLGNVRVVLTDEQQSDCYPPASMETAQSTTEEALFSNVGTTRNDLPAGYPTDTYTNPNNKVAKTNGSGNKIGPAQVLKVMAGDRFNLRVSSWYKTYGASPGTPVNPLTDLLNALTNNIGSITSTHGGVTGTELQNSNVLSPGATTFLSNQPNNTGKPKAYVNWILFDEQFKYVGSSSGAEQVGANEEFKVHLFNDKPIEKSGYLYVYVSNETPNIDVFFDNLQVTHIRGPLLETNEYYPFGLLQAGISYKMLKGGYAENKKKYNSIDFENDLEINTYDAFFRELDPQTGRWWQVDPVTDGYEDLSPYASMYDNPMKYSDPLGNEGESCCLTGVLTWIFNIGGSPEQRIENVKSNINGISNAVSGAVKQMGENAKANWEAKRDPLHQILMTSPIEMISGPGTGLLKGTLGTAAKQEVQVLKAVEKYEVGSAKDLSKISVKDGLDIHHVSQSKPAGQLIKDYDKATAPAIALPKSEHKAIPTLKGTNTAGNARQQLAKDVKDLRRFTNAPNSSLQKLIDLNKKMYPESFKK